MYSYFIDNSSEEKRLFTNCCNTATLQLAIFLKRIITRKCNMFLRSLITNHVLQKKWPSMIYCSTVQWIKN